LEELKSLKHKIGGSKATDVTGGMFGKMQEITTVIEHNIPTLIANATKAQRVYKALIGEKVSGTIIEKG
jgi:isopentenyl phosphate kinase